MINTSINSFDSVNFVSTVKQAVITVSVVGTAVALWLNFLTGG